MKYLKNFEYINESIQRKNIVDKIVSEMIPNPVDVNENLYDMFLPFIDDGIEFNNIELVTFIDEDPYAIYYPLDKKPHPLYSSDNIDKNIIKSLTKSPKAYYSITFGYNVFHTAKRIQNVEYISKIDWTDQSLSYIFELVKECAKDVWDRFNKLYSLDLVISETFVPMINEWKKSDQYGVVYPNELSGSKIIWIVDIKNI